MTKKIRSKLVFSTPRFDVIHDEVDRNNGDVKNFYYIKKPSAVAAVICCKEKIGLIKINRHIFNAYSYEIVGGRIEENEDPLVAIKRELLEELGLTSNKWTFVNIIHPLPSVTTEKVYLYAAEIDVNDCYKTNEDEDIVSFEFFSEEELLRLVMQNEVNCSVDGYAILYFLTFKDTFIWNQ